MRFPSISDGKNAKARRHAKKRKDAGTNGRGVRKRLKYSGIFNQVPQSRKCGEQTILTNHSTTGRDIRRK